jgi:putative ABC transport system substrate-binding protein
MKRREFIAGVGGASIAWRLPAHAQQPSRAQRGKRIGVLLFGTPDTEPNLGAFLGGLRELDYIEGKNIFIEYRYAEASQNDYVAWRQNWLQASLI